MQEVDTTAQNDTEHLLELLIKALVDKPEAVHVDCIEGTQSNVFVVTVHPEDVRRVIGRKGRTVDAIRELLVNIGGKNKRRYILEIVEP